MTDVNPQDSGAQDAARNHVGIAEQGKIYALAGNYNRALYYYHKAIRLSVEAEEPEVVFRHYLECLLESLEHMGSYPEIIDYCKKAIKFYDENPPGDNPLALRDLAHIHQRLGIAWLKKGNVPYARKAFDEALKALEGTEQSLPLTAALVRWMDWGVSFDLEENQGILAEIVSVQYKNGYFSVRRGTVDSKRAVKIDEDVMKHQLFGAGVLKK